MKLFNKLRRNSRGFSHVELFVVVVVVVVVGSVGYFVYSKDVAHAASWSVLGFQSTANPAVSTAGISAVACQTLVKNVYHVQVEVTDTNTTFGSVVYRGQGINKAGNTVHTFGRIEPTSSFGPDQQVTLLVGPRGTFSVSVRSSAKPVTTGGYFVLTGQTVSQPTSGSQTSGSQTTAVSSAASGSTIPANGWIAPAQVGSCPSSTTPVSNPTSAAVSGSDTGSVTGSVTE